MRRCIACRELFPVEDLGDTHKCRDCDPVFGLQRGMHDDYSGHWLFLNQPERLERINLYAVRAELKLPLFE